MLTMARAPDFIAALAGFLLLTALRVPPLVVVVLGAAFGVARSF